MDVLYYYYYFFYSKLLKESDPHFATILSLSVSESLITNFFLYFFFEKYYSFKLEPLHLTVVYFVIVLFNAFYYLRGRGKLIVHNQPKYFGNTLYSILITLLFFILSISLYFLRLY